MAGTFRGHTFNALMQPNAVDDRPLAFRSTLAPFGTYANPDGSESVGFAWPAAVTEPINALQRLAQNSFTEDGRLGIPDPRHPENLSDMETLLWTGFGSNALKGSAGAALRPLQQPTILEQYHAANNLPHPGYGYLQEPVAYQDATWASDTAKPGVANSNKNANIFDPPSRPQRPFEAYYPKGDLSDERGRLTHDIEGRPLTAKYVVGRKVVGGKDEALPAAEYDALSEALFGNRIARIAAREIGGDAGRFKVTYDLDGRPIYQPLVADNTIAEQAPRVAAHEIAHGLDYFAGGRFGIPDDGLKRELGQVYHDLNDASWRRGQPTPTRYQTAPDQYGYRGDDIRAENMAEAIRGYMADPNYMKTVAPNTAKRIREFINENPKISPTIQFNSDTGRPSLAGGVLGASSLFDFNTDQQY